METNVSHLSVSGRINPVNPVNPVGCFALVAAAAMRCIRYVPNTNRLGCNSALESAFARVRPELDLPGSARQGFLQRDVPRPQRLFAVIAAGTGGLARCGREIPRQSIEPAPNRRARRGRTRDGAATFGGDPGLFACRRRLDQRRDGILQCRAAACRGGNGFEKAGLDQRNRASGGAGQRAAPPWLARDVDPG